MLPVTRPRVVFVAHNRRDSAVRRRALSFLEAGVELQGFMYRRDGDHEAEFNDWPNVDLGYVHHGQLRQRLGRHINAMKTLFQHRHDLMSADALYVRNLDLLILSWFALRLSRSKTRLVYECLDIHQVMTRPDWKGRLARLLESFMLKRIDTLVVSSPGFLRHYFGPIQKYRGSSVLLENKLLIHDGELLRPSVNAMLDRRSGPLVLVWVGILRCQKTLSVLKQLARLMGDEIQIRFHGMIADNVIDDFEEQISNIENMSFHSRYTWPSGLAEAYDGAHFVWSQELEWAGGNSDWLLPNRIYEASHQGVLSIAIEGTETANMVTERGLGFVLEDARAETVADFLRRLDRNDLCDQQQALLLRDEGAFVSTPAEFRGFVKDILGADSHAVLGITSRLTQGGELP